MRKYKVIVAGSRGFKDYEYLEQKLLHVFSRWFYMDVTIISGMADGADSLGLRFAKEYMVDYKEMPADWSDMTEPCVRKTRANGDEYNALAGHKRNQSMADIATHLVLFWDGKSTGSADMLKRAQKKGLIIKQYII